ncbi:cysteine synthase A [Gluconobacter thailandicus F149-1 = NBRC 100600]|uniref:cysteine synthase n=2 Tax=Gluconobacter thailandicus TaxID=257438 RepID=A0AAP9JI40_GLUTH|nr:cysteine synthase A [Gluconobacter thailandicus]AFW00360.1 cysteine synthase [Gluconobacter oxydans H24]ANQ40885.1 cysteine synthase A [Gluconobacter oxydans]GAN90447.1 cysteine synthase A [Gluconobacter frateurii M-2]KXV53979.1 cysteine synthase [Gluconobacter thailandicus]QEH96079.1 cysteine synthase A [Gluconobacter thailandicus]
MNKKVVSSPAPFEGYAAPRGRVYNSFLETVGGTPLVALPRLTEQEKLHGRLLLKLEFFNPLGSVKDRIGVAMLRDAETRGLITPGRTVLIEPTSGNTGISLAFAAVALGYRLIVTMPESASTERRKMLRLMGATTELTPANDGMAGAIRRAEELMETLPDAWMPSQFENDANPAVHEQTTALEIWNDTAGQVDMVVAGLGTGGTASGIAHGLKKFSKAIKVIGVEPRESAVLHGDEPGPHGIQGIGPGFQPDTLDLRALDSVIEVSEQESLTTARLCAAVEGIPIGISSGAALYAGMSLAKKASSRGKTIVVIAPSFAERYLSTQLFDGLA